MKRLILSILVILALILVPIAASAGSALLLLDAESPYGIPCDSVVRQANLYSPPSLIYMDRLFLHTLIQSDQIVTGGVNVYRMPDQMLLAYFSPSWRIGPQQWSQELGGIQLRPDQWLMTQAWCGLGGPQGTQMDVILNLYLH